MFQAQSCRQPGLLPLQEQNTVKTMQRVGTCVLEPLPTLQSLSLHQLTAMYSEEDAWLLFVKVLEVIAVWLGTVSSTQKNYPDWMSEMLDKVRSKTQVYQQDCPVRLRATNGGSVSTLPVRKTPKLDTYQVAIQPRVGCLTWRPFVGVNEKYLTDHITWWRRFPDLLR